MDNQTQPPISVTDLAVLRNLIAVACERGAFRAPEMTAVGQVYDRLNLFLEQVISQVETEQRAQPKGEPNA
jgi:hypothetical protein